MKLSILLLSSLLSIGAVAAETGSLIVKRLDIFEFRLSATIFH